MSGKFATGTTVAPEKSRTEIETTLRRYGADEFASGWDSTRAVLGFKAHDRRVRFLLPMPSIDDIPRMSPAGYTAYSSDQRMKMLAAEERRRWRCLLLAIKAKLEVVDSGIAEFEEEFMAHIVMPDGRTVAEHAMPVIAEAYNGGTVRPLLALGSGG